MATNPAWDLFHQAKAAEGREGEKVWVRFWKETYPEVRRRAGQYLFKVGATRRLGDVTDADDVASEAYYRFFKARSAIEIPPAWINRVVYLIALEVAGNEPTEILDDNVAMPATTTEEDNATEPSVLAKALRLAIQELPGRRRQLMTAFINGVRREDLAGHLGIKRNSADQLFRRAVIDLQRRLWGEARNMVQMRGRHQTGAEVNAPA